MKKAKRLLCMVLAVVFAMTMLLAGCGRTEEAPAGQTSKEDTAAATTAAQTEESKPALEPYELSWYFINDKPLDNELVEAEINKYLQEKINATIKLNPLGWGEYGQKVDMMIAANEPFDMAFSSSWMGFYQNVAKDAFVEISDLLEKYGQDVKKNEDPVFWKGATVNGKLYGVPVNKEAAHAWGYLYNKDMADKYGIDMSTVKSEQDLTTILKTIKENEPTITPVYPVDPVFALNIARIGDVDVPVGVENNTADYKIFNRYENQAFTDIIKLHRDWYKAGYIAKDIATKGDPWAPFGAGKAFAIGANLKPGKDAEVQPNHKFKVAQVMYKPVVHTDDINGCIQVISKTSKNPERAMMFLNLYNSDPVLNNLVVNGIEGTHYVKGADGRIELAEAQKGDGKRTYSAPSWQLGNNFINYLWSNEDPNKWENFKNFNKSAEPTSILGFIADIEPVKTEVAAVKNVGAEFNGLVYGALDPEKALPKYVEKLKAAGIDKIMAEWQGQLDKWVAENKK